MVSHRGFVSLITNDVERVFMCLVVICVFFFKFLLSFLYLCFKIWLLDLLNCEFFILNLDICFESVLKRRFTYFDGFNFFFPL